MSTSRGQSQWSRRDRSHHADDQPDGTGDHRYERRRHEEWGHTRTRTHGTEIDGRVALVPGAIGHRRFRRTRCVKAARSRSSNSSFSVIVRCPLAAPPKRGPPTTSRCRRGNRARPRSRAPTGPRSSEVSAPLAAGTGARRRCEQVVNGKFGARRSTGFRTVHVPLAFSTSVPRPAGVHDALTQVRVRAIDPAPLRVHAREGLLCEVLRDRIAPAQQVRETHGCRPLTPVKSSKAAPGSPTDGDGISSKFTPQRLRRATLGSKSNNFLWSRDLADVATRKRVGRLRDATGQHTRRAQHPGFSECLHRTRLLVVTDAGAGSLCGMRAHNRCDERHRRRCCRARRVCRRNRSSEREFR